MKKVKIKLELEFDDSKTRGMNFKNEINNLANYLIIECDKRNFNYVSHSVTEIED